MMGVCFHGVQDVRWSEVEDPTIEQPKDVIVQVEVAGMCGSDLHPFFGRETGLDDGTVMGHEFVGRVVEVGSGVKKFKLGDRVYAPFSTSCGECFYCRSGLTSRCLESQLFGWRSNGRGLHGGQAEKVRVPNADGTLLRVPGNLSPESALLLGDNFSTGYFCADMANIDPNGLTVVIGCGSVGILSIIAAKMIGAKQVLAIDRIGERRSMALSCGASFAMAPDEEAYSVVKDLTEGRGADSVMELVGLPQAQALAYELIRPGGVMSVIGCHTSPSFAFSPVDAYDKNLTYKTGRCPARHYMELLTDRVLQGEVAIDQMITHRFAPQDCIEAYDIFANQKQGCIKSLFVF